MAKSLCHLLMYVNHAPVMNFNAPNMSFKAICENKILAKISEFTVYCITLPIAVSAQMNSSGKKLPLYVTFGEFDTACGC